MKFSKGHRVNCYSKQFVLSLPLLIPLCLLSYIGGLMLMIGIVFVVPALFLAGCVSIMGIVSSIKKRRFMISSLFVLPVLLAAFIGFGQDSYQTNQRVKRVTLINHKVQAYRTQHGYYPESLDSLDLKGVSLKRVYYSADSSFFCIRLFDVEVNTFSSGVVLKGRP